MISQDVLKSIVEYDSVTGVFRWLLAKRKPHLVGERAGSPGTRYRYIKISGRKYAEHQLAWLYVYGEMVRGLDHANGDPHDNRIDNLRLATQAQNIANAIRKPPTCGVRGVSLHKQSGLFRARVAGQSVGYFKTVEEAGQAWRAAACAKHGEFARLHSQEIVE